MIVNFLHSAQVLDNFLHSAQVLDNFLHSAHVPDKFQMVLDMEEGTLAFLLI